MIIMGTDTVPSLTNERSCMKSNKLQAHWRSRMVLPWYMVLSIGDRGKEETFDGEGNVESDDLRLSIELPTGVQLLLDTDCRLLLQDKGLVIQVLTSTEEIL